MKVIAANKKSQSIGDSVLIFGVSLFASWTVLCYAMVLSGAGFSDLTMWSLPAVIVGLVIGSVCVSNVVSTDAGSDDDTSKERSMSAVGWGTTGILLALTVTAMTLRYVDAAYWSVWTVLLCITVLVFRTIATTSTVYKESLTSSSMLQTVGITTLVCCGAILVAITHRPDLDDAQYLNFVVTAIDFPSESLFSYSGLWRDHSVPLELPVYRFHTYELLVAALSDVFGVDHKTVYYLILAPLFGGVAVLVHWRLAQFLLPQYALSIVLVWLVLMIALGESHREFGNFAFVRLYQGKALLVTVALPLCLLLALRFAEAPDWRRALALGAAVIASVGMSSSALAAVPFVVAAALGGGLLRASRASVAVIVAGGLASLLILIAIGALLVVTMGAGSNGTYARYLPSAGSGLATVLGEGILGALVLAVFPLAPLFVSNCRRRRLYATTTLIFVVAVLNPWTAPFLAKMLDSALLWRLFWSVPLVASAAVSLAALAALTAGKLPQFARHTVLPLVLIMVLVSSHRLSISPENQTTIGLPRYKVEPIAHDIAGEIVRNAPLYSVVYAPISIAHLITTFRLHPYPLVVRPEYLGFERIRNHFGDSELDRRRRVIGFLEGSDTDPATVGFFQAQLVHDEPAFVVYEHQVQMAPMIGAALSAAGYVGEKRGGYLLWQRE